MLHTKIVTPEVPYAVLLTLHLSARLVVFIFPPSGFHQWKIQLGMLPRQLGSIAQTPEAGIWWLCVSNEARYQGRLERRSDTSC